ncbi:hypothetical protein MsAm2_08850 [Methanolapillus ohkumae]|uniref:Uncharacterized protein n=1 Tax=Methanolapillus ohkumae TaxID=3028298 RepID=A0AA96ZXI5_9EURY|nr:hypothetical protein MsAm2_08850 [Methanosarcinaceae archaeon Am2]
MKNDKKYGILFIFLIIILYSFAYVFSRLTNYNISDSIMFFVSFPLIIIIALISQIPKIWKIITFLFSLALLYIVLYAPFDLLFFKFLFFIFLIIYIILIAYFSEKNRKRMD